MCNRAIICPTYDDKTTTLKESLSYCNWEWPSKKELSFVGLRLDGERWMIFKGKVLKYWVKKGVKTKFNAF